MNVVTLVSYLAIVLHAVSIGLGAAILGSAWHTLRPARGVHLMWWHILAITVAVWILETLLVLLFVSDLRLFNSTTLLPGPIPFWFVCVGTFALVLVDVSFWLILKVQRGRRQLQQA